MPAPRGKACFVRQWGIVPHEGGGPGFVRAYQAAGFSWAIVDRFVTDDGHTRQINGDAEHWEALRAAAVPCYSSWILPDPASWEASLSAFVADAAERHCRGVVVDPEVEWTGHAAEAERFAGALRAECDAHGLEMVVTSYGSTTAHPSFPWHAFAICDWAIAQTYDRDLAFDPRYMPRALREWAAKGYHGTILAAGLWNHAANTRKTAAEVARHLALFPRNLGSVACWPTIPIAPDVLIKLREWRIGGGRSAGGAGVLALLAALGVGAAAYALTK